MAAVWVAEDFEGVEGLNGERQGLTANNANKRENDANNGTGKGLEVRPFYCWDNTE